MADQEALRQHIVELQSNIAAEALDRKSQSHVVRQLIGSKKQYDFSSEHLSQNRAVPWSAGDWAPGVSISEDGNKVTFDFQPPMEDLDEDEPLKNCTMEDLVSFALAFYKVQLVSRQPTPELMGAVNGLQEAQLYLLANRVCGNAREQAQEAINKAVSQMQKEKSAQK